MKWRRARTGQLYWAEDGSGFTWEWEILPEDEELAKSWEETYPEFAAWLRGEVLTEPELFDPYWEDPRWIARNGIESSVFDRQVDSPRKET
jgi:hypothetical protein